MKRSFGIKRVCVVLSVLLVFLLTAMVSACSDKPTEPSNPDQPGTGEPTVEEVYEKSFDILSQYIKTNSQLDQTFENGHGYSFINAYTNSEELLREYSLNLIYMEMFNSLDAINFEWSVNKLVGTDTLSMSISEQKSQSVKVEWTSGITGNIGVFYIEPQKVYKNTNIMFTDYNFNEEYYGFEVDSESEVAINNMMVDERYATQELSYFLETVNMFLDDELSIALKDFTFDKIGEETKFSPVLKIIDFEEKSFSLKVGERHRLSYVIYPYFVADKVEVTSSNNAVLTVVEDGLITGVGKGTATVILKAGTHKKEYTVVVKEKNNVDYASEFFENNDGKRFDLNGKPISAVAKGTAFFEVSYFDLDSGERLYMINYFSNQRSYEKLDVVAYSLALPLNKDAQNIADEFSKSVGTYSVCTETGTTKYDMTTTLDFELNSDGEIYDCSYKPTEFSKGLQPIDSLRYLANMKTSGNICLNGLKMILAKNANAYFDINKTPSLSLTNENISNDSAKFSYISTNYFNEHITSAEIYKNGVLVKDCTVDFCSSGIISGLLSNTSYVLKVRCGYNKNDGLGERFIEESFSFRTDVIPNPEFTVDVSTTTSSVSIRLSNQNSTQYRVSSIKLYKNSVFVMDMTAEAGMWKAGNLLSNTVYTAEITYTYDLNDGNGLQTKTKVITVSTQEYTDPTVNLVVDSNYTDVDYSITTSNTANLDFSIIKVELYKGSTFIKDLGTNHNGHISDLLAGNEYLLRITCTFDKNDGYGTQTKVYSEIFETRGYAAPTFQHTATTSYDSIEYNVIPTAVPEVNYSLTKVEVWQDNSVVFTGQSISDMVSDLFSDTEYTVKVYYAFNLQNGLGEQSEVYSFTVRTKTYITPNIEINNIVVNQNEFTFDTTLTDLDNLAEFSSLKLYLNDDLVAELGETDEKVFNSLLFGNNYRLVVEYCYNKNDGKGMQYVTDEKYVHTYTKLIPSVDVFVKSFNDDDVTFDVVLTDSDSTATITKIELMVNNNVVSTITEFTDFNALALNGLNADNVFDIVVHYAYDLSDSAGVHIETKVITSTNTKFVYEKTADKVIITGINSQYTDDVTTLQVPDSIEGISNIVINSLQFERQASVKNLILSNHIVEISFGAFQEYVALENITLPFVGTQRGGSSNTFFGYIFGATSYSGNQAAVPETLKSVVITDDTTIAQNAFYNCDTITKVVVPESVTSIGLGAFKGCVAIEDITLPFVGNSLTAQYHDAVFGYIFGYVSKQVREDSESSDGDDHYDFRPETSNAFINAHYIPIPTDTTWQYSGKANYRLKSYHYYIPTTIKNVTITVQTDIPLAAFNGCDFLQTIDLPDETKSIGAYAFQNCSVLKRLNSETDGLYNIPVGVTEIGGYTFRNCVLLEDLVLGNNVTSIGSYAFSGCSLLSKFNSDTAKELIIPNGVEIIDRYAFQNVLLVTKVVVPESVTSIGLGAFKGCVAIEDITLPFVGNSLTAQYHDAVFGYIFGYVSKQVREDSESSDGDDHYDFRPETSNAFINAHYIPIPTDTTWQYSGKANYRLKSYHYYIPTTIKNVTITVQTDIPIAAFNNCSLVESIILPYTVETHGSIGEYAFQNCNASISYSYIPQVSVPWDGVKISDKYHSGNGTMESPYVIFDGSQLAYFAQQVNSGIDYQGVYFELGSNINLNGKEFFVIGANETTAFAGIFDGKGYKIKNFTLTASGTNNGLFGYCKGNLKNICIENCTLTATVDNASFNGLLVGYLTGTVENCSVQGLLKVSASGNTNTFAGGLVGNNNGVILNSYADVTVNATGNYSMYAGGFVGQNNGTITDCYAAGDVVVTSKNFMAYAGGFVGENKSLIHGVFACGNVTAKGASEAYSRNGGFIAVNGGTLEECYRDDGQVLTKYTTIGSAYCNEGIVASKADILAFCETSWDNAVWDFGGELPKLK